MIRWGIGGVFFFAIAASCDNGVTSSDPCSTPCDSTNPCHVATLGCDDTTGFACVDTGNKPDGTACPSGVCVSGVCTAAQCIPGQKCDPPDGCHDGTTSCDVAQQKTTCNPATPKVDGTPCGKAGICKAGACSETRTITGAITTTYEKDDLTKTTVATPALPGTTLAALVAGTAYPGTIASNGTFSVPSVPYGNYWLCFTVNGDESCQEHAVDVVNQDTLVAARPDLALVTKPTPVTIDVTNADPYVKGSFLQISSAQGGVNLRPFQGGGVAQPATGVTSFSALIDWSKGNAGNLATGLPDATKGDIVYVSMAPLQNVGTGGATAQVRSVSQYAKLTDWTVNDGASSTENVPLIAAPQTGTASYDVRYSQFAALSSKVNPSASPSAFFGEVFGHTYSVAFPDLPGGRASVKLVSLQKDLTTGTGTVDGGVAFLDYDYGSYSYGQFFDNTWKEMSYVAFGYAITFTAPSSTPTSWGTSLISLRAGSFASPLVPTLGPPEAPAIAAQDAFTPHSGVGLTPTVSWKAPTLGTASSYSVTIVRVDAMGGATVLTPVFDVFLSETTFEVPAGVLLTGATYFADISANAGPWAVVDVPGYGVPIDTADCVTATFTP